MGDSELIRSYLSGNEAPLEALISKNQQRIFSYILVRIQDQDLANDIFQDTFIKVIRTLKLGKYNEEGKFLPWVMRIAHNLIIEEPGVAWINDTRRTVVRRYDLATGQQQRAYEIRRMKGIKPLLLRSAARAMRETGPAFFSSKRKATARPLYLRGLALHGDLIFAGFSPATIFCIDRHSGKLVDAYFHSDDARDCIHGLAVSD